MGKVICMGNQKGGVGKSTMTSFLANYLFEQYKEKRVIVIDSDDLQNTLYKIREEELDVLEEQGHDRNELIKRYYPIVRINSKDLPSQIDALVEEYDYVLIDLPGNLKQEGVVTAYSFVDHLFVPTRPTKVDIDSTIDFFTFFHKNIVPIRNQAELRTTYYMFFNMVKVNTTDFKEAIEERDSMDIPILKAYITDSVPTFQSKVSTLYSYKNSRYGGYDEFFNEVLEIIK